jgi:hypothetical protein
MRARSRRLDRQAFASARLGLTPAIASWLVLGTVLAAVTSRVTDWFVMPDELLYERLGISIAQTFSPLPHLHGETIPHVSQLYPLLLAPAFGFGSVAESLHAAHILNAFVMTSTAIPVYLLGRSVLGRMLPALFAAMASICIPWMVYSSFLLTEVVAYPAFAWCLVGLHRAMVDPSARNDLLAAGGLVLAVLARTQLVVLAAVLPVAILLYELALARADGPRAGARNAFARHRLLAIASVLLVGAIAVLAASGRLASTFGIYAVTATGTLLPSNVVSLFSVHLAQVALGLGILPFTVAVAWLLAGCARAATKQVHAFALLGTITIAFLALQVTSFDSRFGQGVIHDRYLFYLAPIVLIAFAGACLDSRWPRLSLVIPTAVVSYGFSDAPFPVFEKLHIDTPVSILDDTVIRIAQSVHGAHILMAAVTILATALFVEATFLLRRSLLVPVLATFVALTLAAETSYAFVRLFRVDDTAGRPITGGHHSLYDWIDRRVGSHANVTGVPYPVLPGDYWSNVSHWWDMEFWNKSIDRAAYVSGSFEWLPSTFPRTVLRFDPTTGVANTSPTRYVALAVKEARFHLLGTAVQSTDAVTLIDTVRPWRADWTSSGLHNDGWTKPGVTGKVRIFAAPGQEGWRVRFVTLQVWAPADVASRPFRVVTNLQAHSGAATNTHTVFAEAIRACVPPQGFAEVSISTPDESGIPQGNLNTNASFEVPRAVGVYLAQIALADELGPRCAPRPAEAIRREG